MPHTRARVYDHTYTRLLVHAQCCWPRLRSLAITSKLSFHPSWWNHLNDVKFIIILFILCIRAHAHATRERIRTKNNVSCVRVPESLRRFFSDRKGFILPFNVIYLSTLLLFVKFVHCIHYYLTLLSTCPACPKTSGRSFHSTLLYNREQITVGGSSCVLNETDFINLNWR